MIVKSLDGLSRAWLWLTVLLMPVLALAGGLGFQAAGFFMGVSAILVWLADRSAADYLKSRWAFLLLVFTAWAWLSQTWSVYDGSMIGGNASLLFVLTVTLLFIPLILIRLSDRMSQRIAWAVIAAGVIGIVLMLVEAASDYALTIWADPVRVGEDPIRRRSDAEMNLGRGQVSYAQLAWPIMFLMVSKIKKGWVLAAAFLAALLMSSHLNSLTIIIPAMLVSAGFAALAWLRPRLGVFLALIFACALIALAPVLGVFASLVDAEAMRQLPLSWEHRLRMWGYSLEIIQQAPFFGQGFDSSRAFDELTFQAPDGRDIPVISLHPHNIGLQIWLETGLVGAVLACGFICALIKPALAACESPLKAVGVAGLIAATATCGAVTIGVWQHWWWALIMISASLLILRSDDRRGSQ